MDGEGVGLYGGPVRKGESWGGELSARVKSPGEVGTLTGNGSRSSKTLGYAHRDVGHH